MRAWVRHLLVAAAALTVWLVAMPAHAAAPFCDDRGAIMLAPPPTLDTPNASIDLGEPGECGSQYALGASLDQGSRTDPFPSPPHFEMTLAHHGHLVVAAPARAAALASSAFFARPGVRERLERPPR